MSIKRITGAALAALLAAGLVSVSPAEAAKPGRPSAAPSPVSPAELANVAGKVGSDTSPKLLGPKGMPGLVGAGQRSLTACPGSACYSYSGVQQNFTDAADGFAVDVSVSNPYLARSTNNTMGQNDAHTLVETAVLSPSSSGGGARNIVEIGWQVNPGFAPGGDSKTRLFVARWEDGTFMGYNGAAGAGFVDLSGNVGYSPIGPAGDLTSWVGTSKRFQIKWLDNTASGNREGWWVAANNLWVGYYPQAEYAGETFTTADEVQTFGEIASSGATGVVESCTDMGSGSMAGTSPSTVLTNYSVFGSTDTADFAETTNTTAITYWGLTTVGTPVTTVRIGGPGYDSDGDEVGEKASCAPATAGTAGAGLMQAWEQECPDNGTTGCDAGASWTVAGTTLNTCYTVPAGFEAQVLKNNSGVSGRYYNFYRDLAAVCGGSTVGVGNAASVHLADDWDFGVITSVKRTG